MSSVVFLHFLTLQHNSGNVVIVEVSQEKTTFIPAPRVKRIVLAAWTEKELTDLDRNLVCQAVSGP